MTAEDSSKYCRWSLTSPLNTSPDTDGFCNLISQGSLHRSYILKNISLLEIQEVYKRCISCSYATKGEGTL